MAEYHIGPATLQADHVYAGVLSKGGKTWLHKSDVTSEFWQTVVRLLAGHEITVTGEGKTYTVRCVEVKP